MLRHSHLVAEDDESRKTVFRRRNLATILRGSWEAMKIGANILRAWEFRLDWKRSGKPVLVDWHLQTVRLR